MRKRGTCIFGCHFIIPEVFRLRHCGGSDEASALLELDSYNLGTWVGGYGGIVRMSIVECNERIEEGVCHSVGFRRFRWK